MKLENRPEKLMECSQQKQNFFISGKVKTLKGFGGRRKSLTGYTDKDLVG